MVRGNEMKAIGVLFIFCICFLFSTCLHRRLDVKNEYPSDIIVSGMGTLKYTRTLWDHGTRPYRGIDYNTIWDAKIIDGEIWILASIRRAETLSLFKGLNKSVSANIQCPYTEVSSWRWRPELNIILKGDFIIFVAEYREEVKGEKFSSSKSIYYIIKVHRTTLNQEYIRIPVDLTGQLEIYHSKGEVFLIFKRMGNIISCYTLNNNCDNIIEINEEKFMNLYSPDPDFVIDGNGRHYRLNNNSLEVSVDNGTTWYHNDMGTNNPRGVIVQNESIYVFCWARSFGEYPTYYVGGGIHEFTWK